MGFRIVVFENHTGPKLNRWIRATIAGTIPASNYTKVQLPGGRVRTSKGKNGADLNENETKPAQTLPPPPASLGRFQPASTHSFTAARGLLNYIQRYGVNHRESSFGPSDRQTTFSKSCCPTPTA